MKNLCVLLAVGFAPVFAGPAFAQDEGQDISPTRSQVFSGGHVEATVGWNHLDMTSLKDIDPTADVGTSRSGVKVGGAVGYDFPLDDNTTLGFEVGLYGNTVRWTNTQNLVAGTFNTSQVNAGRDFYIGTRWGYALNHKTQIFAKGGFTNTLFGVTGTNGAYVAYSGTGSNLLYQGVSASGYRVGGGIEQRLFGPTFMRVEYDYSHYASGQFNYVDTTPDFSHFDLHATQQQVLVSVGLRF